MADLLLDAGSEFCSKLGSRLKRIGARLLQQLNHFRVRAELVEVLSLVLDSLGQVRMLLCSLQSSEDVGRTCLIHQR